MAMNRLTKSDVKEIHTFNSQIGLQLKSAGLQNIMPRFYV